MTADCALPGMKRPRGRAISDNEASGSNPTRSEIFYEHKRRFTAQSPSCSPFIRPEILLKMTISLTWYEDDFLKSLFNGHEIQIIRT